MTKETDTDVEVISDAALDHVAGGTWPHLPPIHLTGKVDSILPPNRNLTKSLLPYAHQIFYVN